MILPALLFAAWQSAVPARYLPARPAADAVIAKVNGVPIKASDVEPLVWDWRSNEVVEELTNYHIVRLEAERLGVTVTPAELETETEKALRQLQDSLPQGTSLRSALESQGSAPSRVYVRVRTKLLLDRIVLKSFDPAGFVKISTMIVRPKNEQTVALAEAIKRADDLYARLQKGESWNDLAGRPAGGTLKSAGLLGWRQISAFPEVVRTEMTGLGVGKVTKPAQTVNGFQIFRIEAFGKDAKPEEMESVKDLYSRPGAPRGVQQASFGSQIERCRTQKARIRTIRSR
ncbi:MAG: peptidylprolyl isomerase [Fimbriimonadales bacterium]